MTELVQTAQRLKIEISSSLDSLSLDNLAILSKFVAFLQFNSDQPKFDKINGSIEINIPQQTMRIASPRLVHRHQVVDFKQEIFEE